MSGANSLQARLAKQREKALAKRKNTLSRGVTVSSTESNPPPPVVTGPRVPNLQDQAQLPTQRQTEPVKPGQSAATPVVQKADTQNGAAGSQAHERGESQQTEHAPVSPMADEQPKRQLTWAEASSAQQQLKDKGLDTSYDPNDSVAEPDEAALDLSDMRAFLHRPAPKTGVVQCHIVREKRGLLKMGTYYLYLSSPETFLLSARKRKNNKTANYKLSTSKEDLARKGQHFFGKVRANFVGTSFTMYDNGMNPKDKHKLDKKKRGTGHDSDSDDGDCQDPRSRARQEMGAIFYETNILGVKGPRRMHVAIPAIKNGIPVVFRPDHQNDSIVERYKAESLHNLFILENKQPVWSEQTRAYVLNFNGRVSEASVKNFQLVSPDVGNDYIVLQFGKTGQDTFTMDVRYPLSPFQAFAIVLTSFDHKLGCD